MPLFGDKKIPEPPPHMPPLIDETTGKPTTVDDVLKFIDNKRPALKEHSEADRRRSFQRKRRWYAFTRTVRIIKSRIFAACKSLWEARDFVVIGLLMALCWVCGYWSRDFRAMEKTNFTDFCWIAGSYLLSVAVAVVKITMRSGAMAADLASDIQKENIDDHGRTM